MLWSANGSGLQRPLLAARLRGARGGLLEGRAWGLGRPSAWATAACYATSGYFVSTLNLYNVVAGAALAPALVAALVESGSDMPQLRRRGLVAAGLLWTLLILAGEPLLGLLALLLALAARVVRGGDRSRSRWRALLDARLLLALTAGTLLAAPQLVETFRILGFSFRANEWNGEAPPFLGSFRLQHLADLFFPFFFGRPDLAENLAPGLFDSYPPLFFTLAPGALALALVGLGLLAKDGRRAKLWSAGAIALGFLFALGQFNPLLRLLVRTSLGEALRFPQKFWLAAALGASLLAGLGFTEAFERGRRRPLGLALATIAAGYLATLVAAVLAPRGFGRIVTSLLATEVPPNLLAELSIRLQGVAFLTLGVLGLLLLCVALSRHRSGISGVLALFCATAFQLWLLRPALPMDDIAPYLAAPKVLAVVPEDAVLMQGASQDFFRPSTMLAGDYPDRRLRWLMRRSAEELYPFTAVLHGRRTELAISPEGLDSFLSQAVTVGLRGFPDARRIDVLEALGVDRLLLDRELDPEALPRVRELARYPGWWGNDLHVYEPVDRAAEVEIAGRIVRAPQMNAAMEAIFANDFDPHQTAILAGGAGEEAGGETATGSGGGGTARIVREAAEEVEIEALAASDSVLFLRRAYLPIWRAEIDGAPARTEIVQLARLGVRVPAGAHRVRFWISRRPLHLAMGVVVVGLLLLLAVARSVAGGRGPGAGSADGTIPAPWNEEPA
ncbi:MAG: hypothetical protein R2862_06100 [Thermoanaerobaculia bacterium]